MGYFLVNPIDRYAFLICLAWHSFECCSNRFYDSRVWDVPQSAQSFLLSHSCLFGDVWQYCVVGIYKDVEIRSKFLETDALDLVLRGGNVGSNPFIFKTRLIT